LESHWNALARDAASAHRAIWHLTAAPEQAVPFLAEQLEAQKDFEAPKRIARLIADLSDNRFPIRSRAADELESLGRLVKADLEKELSNRPSLDVSKRLGQLLERMDPVAVPPTWLRLVRAIEVLEHCGTEEANQALKKLSEGMPASRLTQEAAASLRRVNQ